MLDIKFIRENVTRVKEGTAAKQLDSKVVDEVLDLDEKRRKLIGEIEELRARRNKVSSENKTANTEGKEIKEKLKKLEPELKKVEVEYNEFLAQIPNPPADDVKTGKDESENEIVREEGKPRNFDFTPKAHWELGEALGIIDTERASKVSGARFFYLKGDGALLDRALVNFAFEILLKEGFVPVVPPVMVKKRSLQAMGYMEHMGNENFYLVLGGTKGEEEPEYYLVGTSEQSIGPMHTDEILEVENMPIRYVGYSTCFRREAGSYGKDTKGAFRVHQFNKLEMFSFVKPSEGDNEHEYMLSLEERILRELEIPYQVVKMCSGDLGGPAARKYDLNGWFPAEGKYRELTSTSTTTDFQARRLNIRFKEKGEVNYVHTLNGTAVSQRPLLAILENYQQEDGSILIPNVLQKWMGKEKIAKLT